MTQMEEDSLDPRSKATRAALIEAAESMFAEEGVDNVSARQIGASIGSGNNTVVAYHFGSKDALIQAIYNHRMPHFEARRSKLLREADARQSPVEIADLLRIMWLPLFEQTNHEGKHSYARFLGSLDRSSLAYSLGSLSLNFPVLGAIVRRIEELLPPELRLVYGLRWPIVSRIILSALALIDARAGADECVAQHWFEEAITMATAALTAARRNAEVYD